MTFLLKFEQAGEANVVNVTGIEDALAFVTRADRPSTIPPCITCPDKRIAPCFPA